MKNLNEYRNNHSKEFILIKQCIKKIEIIYKINIGENEIAFIVRMFIENSNYSVILNSVRIKKWCVMKFTHYIFIL